MAAHPSPTPHPLVLCNSMREAMSLFPPKQPLICEGEGKNTSKVLLRSWGCFFHLLHDCGWAELGLPAPEAATSSWGAATSCRRSIRPRQPPRSPSIFATTCVEICYNRCQKLRRPLRSELQRRSSWPRDAGTTGTRSCNLVMGSCNRQPSCRRSIRARRPPRSSSVFATTGVKICYNRCRFCYNRCICIFATLHKPASGFFATTVARFCWNGRSFLLEQVTEMLRR